MELDTIYQPIQEDLQKVEESLVSVADVDIPVLKKLLDYIIKTSGKKVRPALTLFSGKFYDYDLGSLIRVATAMELLHTATLIHDDVVDNSLQRRGKATVNKLWGDTSAVLVGDYLLGKCAELTAETENIEVMKLFSNTAMVISSGELRQKELSFDGKQNRDEYYRWIAAKTASLFSAAAEAGAILANSPEEAIQALRGYGYNLGMAFQVVDDVLDFTGDEVELGKLPGSDLSQGVLTLPTIIFLERYPNDDTVNKILESETAEHIELARGKICQSTVIQDCVDIAHNFVLQACQALQVLPDKFPRSHLVDLAHYVVRRKG